MYTATIKERSYAVELSPSAEINGQTVGAELTRSADGAYLLTLDGKKMVADLVRYDRDNKQVVLRIEGLKYTVSIKEPIDLLLERLGMKNTASRKLNNLKAPMPGLITRILVQEGDAVKQGDPLLVLEAMKMENVFKAAADVVVKSIRVSEKQAVEKGAELITFA